MKNSILASLANFSGNLTVSNGIATFPDGKTVDLAAAAFLDQSDPETLASAYAVLMSKKFNGLVSAEFDKDINKISFYASGLPAHQNYIDAYGQKTWDMLDYASLKQVQIELFEAMSESEMRAAIMSLTTA